MLRLSFTKDGTNYLTSNGDAVNSTDGAYLFRRASSQGYQLPAGNYYQLQTFTIYFDQFYLYEPTYTFGGFLNLDDGFATGLRVAVAGGVSGSRNYRIYVQTGNSLTPSFYNNEMLKPNRWYRIALQKSGTTWNLYINGVLDTTYARPVSDVAWLSSGAAKGVFIGKCAVANYYGNGMVKNFRMYSDFHSADTIYNDYYNCVKPTANKVFDYPMISDLNDISGNGLHIVSGTGTLTTTPSKIFGIHDKGEAIATRRILRCDGVNDYASAGAMTSGEFPTNAFSLRMGIKQNYISGTTTLFQCGTNNNGAVKIQKTTTGIQFIIGDGVSTTSGSTTLSAARLGDTVIYEFTYDGATGFIYVNGLLVASFSCTRAFRNDLNTIKFGTRFNPTIEFHNGGIFNVSVYNARRTASQILTDFNNGYPSLTDCIHYWTFDNDATDQVGSLDATLSGAVYEYSEVSELAFAPTEQTISLTGLGATDSLKYRLEALNNV